MQIIHRIDDFFYTIFPQVKKGDQQALKDAVQKYYTYGPYKPKVIIEDDWLTIEIDTPTILEQDTDYKKVIALCERGKYPEAKPILTKLIEKNPTNSEYYRVMGQILSDEGDQEEAINTLIDALRWDSKNGWALLMMGNIFAKFKDDIPTAMKYYDQALIVNPDDNISINNIGANLMQQGNLQEAKRYFKKALQIDDQYPNTHFALGMIADMEADYQAAFDSRRTIKTDKRKDAIAFEIAMQGTQGYNPDKDNYRISAVKGKKFTGYHILAYYYVSWAIAVPEMLESLKLPYDDEYKLALTLFDPGKK